MIIGLFLAYFSHVYSHRTNHLFRHPVVVGNRIEGCSFLNSIKGNGIYLGLNILGDIFSKPLFTSRQALFSLFYFVDFTFLTFVTQLVATLCIMVVRSVRLKEKSGQVALGLIFLIGFTSIAAAVSRYAVFVWVWSGGLSRLTPGNFGLIEIFWRLEILLGATAYGMAFMRSVLRTIVQRVRLMTASLQSLSRSNESRKRIDDNLEIPHPGNKIETQVSASESHELDDFDTVRLYNPALSKQP